MKTIELKSECTRKKFFGESYLQNEDLYYRNTKIAYKTNSGEIILTQHWNSSEIILRHLKSYLVYNNYPVMTKQQIERKFKIEKDSIN